MPAAPANSSAERRGDTVDIEFVVPREHRRDAPGELERVDVYALRRPAVDVRTINIVKHGTKVASVEVKAPRDPDQTDRCRRVRRATGAAEGHRPRSRRSQRACPRTHARPRPSIRRHPREPPRSRRERRLSDRHRGAVTRLRRRRHQRRGAGNGAFSQRVTVPLVSPPASPAAASRDATTRPASRGVAARHIGSATVQGPAGDGASSRGRSACTFRRRHTTSTKWRADAVRHPAHRPARRRRLQVTIRRPAHRLGRSSAAMRCGRSRRPIGAVDRERPGRPGVRRR